jgi:DNA-binding FadR family transcriptional regulator
MAREIATVEKKAKARFKMIGRKDGLVDQVVQAIEAQILSGRLTVGSRPPAERDFSERLGVSRPVVREAVRILPRAACSTQARHRHHRACR